MQAINAVDLYLLGFLNRFAHRSPIFDQSISFLANQPLLKAGLLTSALWLAWFRPNPNQKLRRELVISTLAATVTSLTFVKVIRPLLPFRLRPMHDGQSASHCLITSRARPCGTGVHFRAIPRRWCLLWQ